MTHAIEFETLLPDAGSGPADQLSLFALLTLGVVDSIASGAQTPTSAVKTFFHAANCLYVRKQMRDKDADAVMSRGVQLPDLFDALPPEEAHRELHHELQTMRAMCLKLLDNKQQAA